MYCAGINEHIPWGSSNKCILISVAVSSKSGSKCRIPVRHISIIPFCKKQKWNNSLYFLFFKTHCSDFGSPQSSCCSFSFQERESADKPTVAFGLYRTDFPAWQAHMLLVALPSVYVGEWTVSYTPDLFVLSQLSFWVKKMARSPFFPGTLCPLLWHPSWSLDHCEE